MGVRGGGCFGIATSRLLSLVWVIGSSCPQGVVACALPLCVGPVWSLVQMGAMVSRFL